MILRYCNVWTAENGVDGQSFLTRLLSAPIFTRGLDISATRTYLVYTKVYADAYRPHLSNRSRLQKEGIASWSSFH